MQLLRGTQKFALTGVGPQCWCGYAHNEQQGKGAQRVLLPFLVLTHAQPSLPPASVYNEDYFANVASSPSLSAKKAQDKKPREREDKKKAKIKDREKRLSGSLRELFGKDKDKDKEPARRPSGSQLRLSHDVDPTVTAAPLPVSPTNSGPVAASSKVVSPRRTSPESDKGKKKPQQQQQQESPGGKLARSEGESSITKLVVKLESDRKMIQVGLPKAPAVERKYLGLSLAELSARDGRLVPIVVSDLIKWMWQSSSKMAGMFVVDAGSDRVQALIHRMEKGLYSSIYEEADVDTTLVTAVVKEFFRQLPDPLFSFDLYERFVARSEDTVSLLLQLPAANLATLKTLFPYLLEVASEKSLQMPAQDLAQVLGPLLLRPRDASAAKGFPGEAVEVVVALIGDWCAVAEQLSRKEREAGGDAPEGEAAAAANGTGRDSPADHVDLFAFLDQLGMLHYFDVFKQLGVSLAALQEMEPADLEQLGVAPEEGNAMLARARRMHLRGGSGGDAQAEEVWEEGDLDPRVRKFLAQLGLEHLVALFQDCQIDWVILDMSAVSDFRELGLDDATILKIMQGLGKDVAVSSAAAPRAIGINGNELELRSAVSDADATLDPKWILDLRAIRVQKKIGIGGYAEVWKAQWKDKTVAFKLLQEDTTEDKRVVDEFRREMAVMSQLDHPNIVAFYGAVDHGRSLAMVLEYAARGDLEGILLDHKTPIPYLQRLRWAKQVAQGLQYLHTRNPRVIHRDIKHVLFLSCRHAPLTVFFLQGVIFFCSLPFLFLFLH